MSTARLEMQVAMLTAENAVLREQIARLERDFMGAAMVMPPDWMLTAAEQRVFAVLLSRPMATKDQIMTALYREFARDEAEPKIVDVFVCKIRRKLAAHGIEIKTVWGRGYMVDDEVRAVLSKRLAPKALEVVAREQAA